MEVSQIRRLGLWSGMVLVLLGLAYFCLIVIMMLSGLGFPPAEPFLTIFNILVWVTAAWMVIFWTILHKAISEDKKLYSLVSLVFIAIFTTLTSINRYVGLTVVRQSLLFGETSGLQWFMPYHWPSVMLALEYLAWGFFFGIACLSLAPAFTKGKLERAIFGALILTGILSLCALVGQIFGSNALSFDLFTFAGVIGWGPGLTITVALITAWFRNYGVNSS